MALFYRLYKDNRRNNASTFGKWYARAVATETVTTEQLAEEMQANCTVKKADILAVLAELVETMKRQLQNSKRVKLDNFGSFKIGMKTKPAETAADFNVSTHVKDIHMLFQPEVRIDKDKKRTRAFLSGCNVKELPKNDVDTQKPDGGGGEGGGGGTEERP